MGGTGGVGAAGAGAAGVSAAGSALPELEHTRVVLGALVRNAESALALLPVVSRADWSGPAAWSFRLAVGVLHREIADAATALREAEHLVDVAAREVAQGV